MTEPLKQLSWYRDLKKAAGRRESGCFAVEGERAIRQAMTAAPGAVIELLAAGEVPADLAGYPVRELTEKQFKSASSSVTPQGLLAVVNLPEDHDTAALPDELGERLLLLESIQDPGNVGTLVRTAAAFGYDGIIMSRDCADPFSPKAVQAAAGTVLSPTFVASDAALSLFTGGSTLTSGLAWDCVAPTSGSSAPGTRAIRKPSEIGAPAP